MNRSLLLASFLLVLSPLAVGCSGGGKSGDGAGDDDDDAATPVIASLGAAEGIPGTSVSIAGSNFGATQGTSVVRFGAAVATTASSWSDSSITAVVPDAAFPGNRAVTVETAVGTSNAIDFGVMLPRAVYVWANDADPVVVRSFAAGLDGTLTVLDPSLTVSATNDAFGGASNGLSLDPGTRRLYAAGFAQVDAFDIHPRTGALTPAIGVPVGAGISYSTAASPDGATVYSSEYDTCLVHSFDAATLAETGSAVGTGAANGCDATLVSHSGNWLFQNNFVEGTVAALAIELDGTLTAGATPLVLPNTSFQLTMDPVRDRFYAASLSSGAIFVVDYADATGVLTENAALRVTFANANGTATSGDGSRLFASKFGSGTVSMFNVAGAGALSELIGSPQPTGLAGGGALAVSFDGTLLYFVDENAGMLAGFSVAGDGALTALAGSPWPLPAVGVSSVLTTY